ncbi:lamin-B2-like [Anneissia japonica]|uniref:lamin-B2-like n=1 Tax=Anneissia japonica TaxID=1529436 RepID=UPI001425B93D|nr:lamin-B2-like [Anneissia japonica]
MSTVSPPAPLSRQQEKAELQHLNERYKAYIAKVRKMREEANMVDSSALLNSIRMLEDEIEVIKNMYEKELNNLRHQLEDTSAARTSADTQAYRNEKMATDLQDRLSVENQRCRGLNDDLASMQRLCSQKEVDLQTSHANIADLTRKLRDVEDDYASLQRTSDDLQHGFDQECVLRKEAQDSNQILLGKLDFQKKVNDEEIAELKHTLDDKANHILALEAKVRELARPDNTLQEMLDRVKRAAAEELQRFKDESEAAYHRNLQELRDQMDLDATNMAQLADENNRLVKEVDTLNNSNQELKNRVLAVEQMNNSMNTQMDMERERSAVHVRALEDKLRDMQDSLVQKMREITLATDGKAPMRAEIEALKVLVEEEENKLRHIPPASTYAPTTLSATSTNTYLPRPKTVSPVRSSYFENKTGLSTSYTAKASKIRPVSVPATMGQGKDYFDSIFGDLQKSTLIYPRLHPKSSPPGVYRVPTMSHDYTTATSSTTGNIKFLEINPDGRFVRLFNTSAAYEEEVGGYMIQQNVGGHPVAVYRFPPRTKFRPSSTITIWAASSLAKHNPPTDLLWKEQHKWGTGPECTTILCKPNGQAVAWTTAAHRFSNVAQSYDQQSDSSIDQNIADDDKSGESNPNPAFEVQINGRPTTVLRRKKTGQSSLSPAKHPTGQYPRNCTHPATGEARVCTLGNDGSSLCRQSRSQNSKPVPDRTPGVLYASGGAGATRTGSAPLRKSLRTTPKKSGTIRVSTTQPNPFMSPHHQHYANINKINSNHHVTFQPPLFRPPVVSSW